MNELEPLEKAGPLAVLSLLAVVARMTTGMKATFREYLKAVEAGFSTEEAAKIIQERGQDIQSILNLLVEYVVDFPALIAEYFNEGAEQAATAAAKLIQQGQANALDVKFDPGNPETARTLEAEQLRFIREITDGQRDTIQAILQDQIKRGANPLEAAREIKQNIGLTANQWQAVRSYQDLLERGSADALDRALRDKRFDATVARAIDENDVLSSSQIERMVGAYTKKMIARRAETIARTESLRTMAIARHEGWRQSLEELDADPEDVEKTWHTTLDGRERPDHNEMDGETVVGLDTPFDMPNGDEMLYPHDPEGSAENVINCRCSVTMLIRQRPAEDDLGKRLTTRSMTKYGFEQWTTYKAFNPDQPRDEHGRWTEAGGGVAQNERGDSKKIYWHGSASGDLRGGGSGLHVGTKTAATEALEARIGIPADGKGWTGNREYGKTLLAGRDTLARLDPRGYNVTGYNVDAPKDDYYPTRTLKYPDGSAMPMNVKPSVEPYVITGPMTNTPDTPHEDFKANGLMSAQIKRYGRAKRGMFYTEVGEDSGSVAATVPGGAHLARVHKPRSGV